MEATLEKKYDDLAKPASKSEEQHIEMAKAVRSALEARPNKTMMQEEVADLLHEKFGKGRKAFIQRMWSDPKFYQDKVGCLYFPAKRGGKDGNGMLVDGVPVSHYKLITSIEDVL